MISDRREEISILGYRKLFAWQKADVLAHMVYEVTLSFPKSEIFGLTSQIRRSALSVPTNIVEGYARISNNEFRHFLSISLGSLAELGYLLDFSFKEKYIKKVDFDAISLLQEECGRLIWGLYKSKK